MSNQNQFEITQKIHQELDKLTETTGIKIEVDFDKYHGHNLLPDTIDCISSDLAYYLAIDNNFEYLCGAIQESQIRQILIAFEEKLGENEENKQDKFLLEIQKKRKKRDLTIETLLESLIEKTPDTKSKALCQKWLNGIKPLFDQNPTQVLTELLEILQNIK